MIDERIPPHTVESETGALGSLLLEGDALAQTAVARYRLTPESFYIPAHRAVFEAIMALTILRRPVDLLTVSDQLRKSGALDKIGGPVTLSRLVDATPTSAHAEWHFEIVRRKFMLRQVMQICHDGKNMAYDADDAGPLIGKLIDSFGDMCVSPEAEATNDAIMGEAIQEWRDAKDGIKPAIGIETPWPKLTQTLCGLEEGLTIVAGRPSAGKTTLEGMMAAWSAEGGFAVARATMDSSTKQLLKRELCRRAGVSMPRLKFGFGRHDQFQELDSARKLIAQLPMYFNDRDTDINQISAWFRTMVRKRKVGLITFDYIQLMMAAEMGRSNWDTVARVTYVSQRLKALAMELRIPAVVLAQLNRNVDTENRRPQLSDLKDSGGIEQDANKVIFLYVDGKKKKEMEAKQPGATKHKRPVWCEVMKHKDGDTGPVPMWLYPPYFRFEVDRSGSFDDDDLPSNWRDNAMEMDRHPTANPDPEGEDARKIRENAATARLRENEGLHDERDPSLDLGKE